MAPLAAVNPVPESNVVADGIRAVLLGPPGSGKGTQVSVHTFNKLLRRNEIAVYSLSILL